MIRLQTFALGVATALAASSFGAILDPIATSGHDQDVVFEAGLATGATGANGEIGSRQFFEDGALSGTEGLPQTLPAFVSTNGNTINYTFQPIEENNIVKFTAGTANKSLTLFAPGAYTDLAVVFTGGSLATATEVAHVAYTIHYAGAARRPARSLSPIGARRPCPRGPKNSSTPIGPPQMQRRGR